AVSLLSSSYSAPPIMLLYFFFFQAEDGIRDFHVTGVQRCALPIYTLACLVGNLRHHNSSDGRDRDFEASNRFGPYMDAPQNRTRSEERRVGKECRARRGAKTDKNEILIDRGVTCVERRVASRSVV